MVVHIVLKIGYNFEISYQLLFVLFVLFVFVLLDHHDSTWRKRVYLYIQILVTSKSLKLNVLNENVPQIYYIKVLLS